MRYRIAVLSFFSGIFLDQVSKWWADESGLVSLNTGISFGLVGGFSQLGLALLSVLFLFLVTRIFWSQWQKNPIWLGLFLAGGTSNLIDRILWSGVRDWLPLPGFSLHNNLADWLVVGSLCWLVVNSLRTPKPL